MTKRNDIWSSVSSVLEEENIEDEKSIAFFNKLKDTSLSKDLECEAADSKEYIYLKMQEKIGKVLLRRKLRLWKYTAVASIALLFVISGLYIFKTESVAPVYAESSTPAGVNTCLTLGDGTVVTLNSGSTLSYPLSFQGDCRSVLLAGEAYFEVAEDKKHPFVVEAGNLKIRVHGTHFNVKSYEEDETQAVTLMEGLVSVGIAAEKPVFLKPDQQILIDKVTNEISISDVYADLYASWKDNECFFENEKLSDIVKILERQFGVAISVISPALKNQRFSGYFTKEEGIFHILNSFKKNRNMSYRHTEGGIEIYER